MCYSNNDMSERVVSIIVPVYNVEAYLPECIDSLLGQTYPHLEVLLIDDGSTDGSGKICDDYAQRDSRVRVVHKPNEGVSVARNTALSIATGYYLMCVDSDDWIELDTLEKCMAILEKRPEIDILEFGTIDYFDGEFAEYKSYTGGTEDVELSGLQILHSYSQGNLPSPLPCAKIYVRDKISDVRFILGRVHEDNTYIFEALIKIQHYYYHNAPWYIYRRNRAGSITHTLNDNIEDMFLNIRDVRDKMIKEHPELVVYANSFMLHRAVDYSFRYYRQGIDVKKYEKMLAPFIESIKAYPILDPTIKKRLFIYMPKLYVRFTVHVLPKIRKVLKWRPFK